MHKDHRGITLVELLIAMAISAVIMAAAAFFLMTAQKNYREAAASANVQSETQILMEQIGTWIMEGNRVKTGAVAGGTTQDHLVIGRWEALYEEVRWHHRSRYGYDRYCAGDRRNRSELYRNVCDRFFRK